MIIALPVPVVQDLFCFIINQHNWTVLFIVTSVLFFFILSCWWLRWLIKKLIVLLNKLFETKKKKPLAVVNFKHSLEDYLKPSCCNWRRSILLIFNCYINTAKLYRTLVETLLESDKLDRICVFPLGVSVKPWGCSKTIIFTDFTSV